MLCLRNYVAWIHGTTIKLQIVLNTPKYLHFNQVSQKNTCQTFLPKNILELKMSSPKRKPSIIPVAMKYGLAPRPAGHVIRIILKLSKTLPYPAQWQSLFHSSLENLPYKWAESQIKASTSAPGQLRGHLNFFSKINIQIPTAWAKMQFKCPIIVSF